MNPRSVTRTRRFPVEAAFSTTDFMSQGAMNWPFLMFTILPVSRRRQHEIGLAAQERRDLQHVGHLGRARHLRHLVHVRQDRHAVALAHAFRISSPRSSPGPR